LSERVSGDAVQHTATTAVRLRRETRHGKWPPVKCGRGNGRRIACSLPPVRRWRLREFSHPLRLAYSCISRGWIAVFCWAVLTRA